MRSISDFVDMGLDVATEGHEGVGTLGLLGALALGVAAVGLVSIVRDEDGDFVVADLTTPLDAETICTFPDARLHDRIGSLSTEELERLYRVVRDQARYLDDQADIQNGKADEAAFRAKMLLGRREEADELAGELRMAIGMREPVVEPRKTPIGMFSGRCRWAA